MLLYESQKSMIYALAFSSDGLLLAAGGRDGVVRIHGLDGSTQSVTPAGTTVNAIAFHPSLPMLAAACDAGWSCFRQEDDGTWKTFGPAMPTSTMDLAYLDRTTLAVGLGERLNTVPGRFELWDLTAGRKIDPFFVESKGVRALTICRRKKIAAWVDRQRHISVWDTRRQDAVRMTLPGNHQAISLHPDGTHLAVASDWVVRIFDLEQKRELHMLKVHKGQASAVAFSPHGRLLATGSWDRTVRLWDPITGREQSVFEWPIGRVNALAFSPDGARLAAGGDTGAIVMWDIE